MPETQADVQAELMAEAFGFYADNMLTSDHFEAALIALHHVRDLPGDDGQAGLAAVHALQDAIRLIPLEVFALATDWVRTCPEDALYPSTTTDGSGAPLVAGRAYRLRSASGQLPPVRGF